MCEYERDDADNLKIIEDLMTALRINVSSKSSLSACQDIIALHGIEFAAEIINDALITRLSAFVTCAQADKFCYYFEYPENWWEALKLRFFPNWLIIKFPIKFKIVDIAVDKYIICPHLPFESKMVHKTWLINKVLEYQNVI